MIRCRIIRKIMRWKVCKASVRYATWSEFFLFYYCSKLSKVKNLPAPNMRSKHIVTGDFIKLNDSLRFSCSVIVGFKEFSLFANFLAMIGVPSSPPLCGTEGCKGKLLGTALPPCKELAEANA